MVPARWLPVTSAQPRLVISRVAWNGAEWHTLVRNLALSGMTTRSTYPVRFVANSVDGVEPAAGWPIDDLGGEVRVVACAGRRNSAHPRTTAERRSAVRPRACAARFPWELALEG
jgi:hypothetical protein